MGGHEGYLTVGLYKNGQPGEIFITMAKEGSTVSGLMDSFATAVSLALQYGVPLKVLCDKFSHTRFEPSGWTPHPEIRYAKSVMDYIFRWLAWKFLPRDAQPRENASIETINGKETSKAAGLAQQFSRAVAESSSASRRHPTRTGRGGIDGRRRAVVRRLRRHHGSQRGLLPLHELRHNQRVFVEAPFGSRRPEKPGVLEASDKL